MTIFTRNKDQWILGYRTSGKSQNDSVWWEQPRNFSNKTQQRNASTLEVPTGNWISVIQNLNVTCLSTMFTGLMLPIPRTVSAMLLVMHKQNCLQYSNDSWVIPPFVLVSMLNFCPYKTTLPAVFWSTRDSFLGDVAFRRIPWKQICVPCTYPSVWTYSRVDFQKKCPWSISNFWQLHHHSCLDDISNLVRVLSSSFSRS